MVSLGTWWRTVRYLKRQQITNRAARHFRRRSIEPGTTPARRSIKGAWQSPARREPSLVGPSCFSFLGTAKDIDPTAWDADDASKLWQYNLHYFDDLNAHGAAERAREHRALLTSWVEANPPGRGVAWDPYPVSLRLVNWIKWLLAGNEPEAHWLTSMAAQARWLSRRVELHLLGNHLFVNAKALVFAGLLFAGREADEWLQSGASILMREIDEQVLRDGGHFERSPMYHALAVEDVLDLLNAITALGPDMPEVRQLRAALAASAPRMLHWLRCMLHPSNQLALFNDCADGIAPASDELESYARRLDVMLPPPPGAGITHLVDSGYVRVACGSMTAVLDLAEVGPDYLPAHAHADTLSFELSIGARRILANGGTSLYETGTRRNYERSTAAHNTVEILGRDSSEVWSSFRVGRRARPLNLVLDGATVSCTHDGYRFLPGKPEHRRSWTFTPAGVVVEDRVTPSLDSVARFFLAPGIGFAARGTGLWTAGDGSSAILDVEVEVGRASVERVRQAQRFGVTEIVDCLAVRLVDGRARTAWSWDPHAHPVS